MCSYGYYITGWGLKAKPYDEGPDLAGVTSLPFRCTSLTDTSQHESWLFDYESENGSTWRDFYYAEPGMFMCGIQG